MVFCYFGCMEYTNLYILQNMTTSIESSKGGTEPGSPEEKSEDLILNLRADIKSLNEDIQKGEIAREVDPTDESAVEYANFLIGRKKEEIAEKKSELIKADPDTIKLGKDALFLENSIKNLEKKLSSRPAASFDPREKTELDAELKSDQEQFKKVLEGLKAKGISLSDVSKTLETKVPDAPKGNIEKVSERSIESPVEAELEVSLDDEDDMEGPLTIKKTGFFSRLSARGKNFLSRVWDKVPQTKGKLHVGVLQFLVNREQSKFAKVKTQIDVLDMSIDKLENAKDSLLAHMKRQLEKGLPGSEILHVQVKKIESEIEGLKNKKDTLASKLKRKMDTIRGNEGERTVVAARFREKYEDKLRPMEEELERVEGLRRRLDKENEKFEKRANEQLKQIADFEISKSQIEEALRLAGKSEWLGIKRNSAVKAIEKQITDMRSRIQDEKRSMMEKYNAINANIADIDARANPYRDRKEAFVRISERESIDMNINERVSGAPYEEIENVYPDKRIDPMM